MNKLLLILITFASFMVQGQTSSPTLNYEGRNYSIVSGDLLTISNAYLAGITAQVPTTDWERALWVEGWTSSNSGDTWRLEHPSDCGRYAVVFQQDGTYDYTIHNADGTVESSQFLIPNIATITELGRTWRNDECD